MDKLKYIVIILFALSLNLKADINITFDKKNVSDTISDVVNLSNVKSGWLFFRKINKDVPTISINIFLKKEHNTFFPVHRLIIKDSASDKEIQIIHSEKDSLAIVNIEFNDYNFDGYADIYIYDGCAILANCFGKVFLYDKDLKKFVRDYAFDDMTSVQVNKEKKEIRSFNQCCAGAESESRTYKYFDGKLTLVKEILKSYSNEKAKFIFVVKEYDEKGNLVNTKEIITDKYELDE